MRTYIFAAIICLIGFHVKGSSMTTVEVSMTCANAITTAMAVYEERANSKIEVDRVSCTHRGDHIDVTFHPANRNLRGGGVFVEVSTDGLKVIRVRPQR